MTKVCVLMLMYKHPVSTQECIRQVADSLNGHSLILWDNSDESMVHSTLPLIGPFMQGFFSRENITYDGNQVNLGVAGGRNQLIEKALVSDADVLVFVDSDVVVIDQQWISRLIKPLERENVGVCGPAGSFVDWTQQHPFVPAPVGECDVVSGWCMAVKRECVQLSGIRMDEDYGLFYEEDSDFCMQIRSLGWDVWNTGQIGLKHVPSNSGANLADRASTLERFADKWRGKKLTKGEGAYG